MLFYSILFMCVQVIFSQSGSEAQHNILQPGSEFKQVLSCDANKQLFIASTDQALNSKDLQISMDLHVHKPDYSQMFNITNPSQNRPEGRTRVRVGYSYELFQDSIVGTIAYFDEPCAVAATGKVIFDASEAGEFTNLGDVVDDFLDTQLENLRNLALNVTLNSTGQLNSSYEVDQLTNYEIVLSAGIADENGNLMVCCEMTPTFPTIPDTFSVVVEANIMNRGYSIIQHEYYSYELDKVRTDVSSFRSGELVVVSDYDAKLDHYITMPNSTHPNGTCEEASLGPFETNFTSQVNGHVVNSRQFLLFDKDSTPTFQELSPPPIVRGVPCEKWSYEFTADGTGFLGLNGSYTVEMFFAHAFWRVPRNFGFRQLMRIKLLGQNFNTGDLIEHIYEYIDFKPFIPLYIAFDQCSVLPNGENCGCSDSVDTVRVSSDSVDTVSVSSDGDNDKTCDGFPSDQAGQYMLFLIVGVLVGVGCGIGIWMLKLKYLGGQKYKEFIISEANANKGVEMSNGAKSTPSSTTVL